MKKVLYCHHCDKIYYVSTNEITLIEQHTPGQIATAGIIYRYSGDCFFKTLSQLKRLDTKVL